MTPISDDRIYNIIQRFERVAVTNEMHGARLDKIEPALAEISRKLDNITAKLDDSGSVGGPSWCNKKTLGGLLAAGVTIGGVLAGLFGAFGG